MSSSDTMSKSATGSSTAAETTRYASATRRALPVSPRFLGSELALIFSRRRNQAGLVVLAAVPLVLAIAVRLDPGGGGPTFVSLITGNGLFVAYAALGFEIVMFLPLAVAMIAGDAVAGEAHLGTLRVLLTVPVGRTRLLVVKYVAVCIGTLLAVLLVAVVGAVAGALLFGAGSMTTLSGTQLGVGAALLRLAITVGYLACCLWALAAVGLFCSTLTEQPIAVTITVMILVILATIADSINQLAWLHPWLLVDHWLAFADVLRDPIQWSPMLHGLGLDAIYIVVFGLAAWARLGVRDVTG